MPRMATPRITLSPCIILPTARGFIMRLFGRRGIRVCILAMAIVGAGIMVVIIDLVVGRQKMR